MRFTLAFVAAVATSASASTLLRRQDSYPNCAIPCLTNADFGSCAQTDITCLCNSSAFITSTTVCIQGACTGTDLANAEAAARSECEAVGVTITSTPTSAPTSSPASASHSASATAPASPVSSAPAASSPAASQPSPTTNGARSNAAGALAGVAALGAMFVL